VLVDTSAWIEFLRATGSPADRALTIALRDDAPRSITGVVLQEVLQGCRDEAHARDVLALLTGCAMVDPVSPATHDHAAMLFRRCRAAGRAVRGTVDCLIAAVALEHQLPVLAVDRDFLTLQAVCGLHLVTP
jgi:predicted nucleic acid-binding protein